MYWAIKPLNKRDYQILLTFYENVNGEKPIKVFIMLLVIISVKSYLVSYEML